MVSFSFRRSKSDHKKDLAFTANPLGKGIIKPPSAIETKKIKKKKRYDKTSLNTASVEVTDLGTDERFTAGLAPGMTVRDCRGGVCTGALMGSAGNGTLPGTADTRQEMWKEAEAFLREYYLYNGGGDFRDFETRLSQVQQLLRRNGKYDLFLDEIAFGAKLAWRNAPRCINRVQWKRLDVREGRGCLTHKEVFQTLCDHVRSAFNNGIIRSSLTVFGDNVRIWNPQLYTYAGYDSSNVGDKGSREFTNICLALGWQPQNPKSDFELLPWVIQIEKETQWFSIPEHLRFEVKIEHPEYPGIGKLGLKWYALPAISSMQLDVGGQVLKCIPFNGWYMQTEIAARNLVDKQRYDRLQSVADAMGLFAGKGFAGSSSMGSSGAVGMWRDRALTALSEAVLYSYQHVGVTIVDHHTAGESFMDHYRSEIKHRGRCAGDWVWLTPPISGGISPVFHLEMLNFYEKPAYLHRPQAPWVGTRYYDAKQAAAASSKAPLNVCPVTGSSGRCPGAGPVSTKKSLPHVDIVYATETGRARRYAHELSETLAASDVINSVRDMADIDPAQYFSLSNKSSSKSKSLEPRVVLFVVSTFGEGQPPMSGETFLSWMEKNVAKIAKSGAASHISFAVLGLGDSSYKDFCGFAVTLDEIMVQAGSNRIVDPGRSDAIGAARASFVEWQSKVVTSIAGPQGEDPEDSEDPTERAPRLSIVDFLEDQSIEASSTSLAAKPPVLPLSKLSNASSSQNSERRPPSANLNGSGRSLIVPKSPKMLPEFQLVNSMHEGIEDTVEFSLDQEPFSRDPGTQRATVATNSTESGLQIITLTMENIVLSPGDHLGVFPTTKLSKVEELAKRFFPNASQSQLRQELNRMIDVSQGPITVTRRMSLACIWTDWVREFGLLGSTSTLEKLMTHYVDLGVMPEPDALVALSKWPGIPEQEAKDLKDIAANPKNVLSLLQVLDAAPALVKAVPVRAFLTYLRPVRARHYSVANDPAQDGVVRLLFKRVDDGQCSNFLAEADTGDGIYVRQHQNRRFRLDASSPIATNPVLMICAGTGVAPMIGFCEALTLASTAHAKPSNTPPVGLYYGEKSPKQGRWVKDAAERWLKQGILSSFVPAWSRATNGCYVQDQLAKNSKQIWQDFLSDQSALVYICGSEPMGDQVILTLKQIIRDNSNTESEADELWASMRRQGRIRQEIFG